ncbi:MAG: acyl-CoA thioesterase II [Myxococcales bacterium]
MSKVLEELVQQLALERIEENLFRGQSQDLGWGRVFGGQVLGQALSAAVQTVPQERKVHSLHSYFLRPGNVNKPIVYEVDRIRDGGSFTTRRVVAVQGGKPIFNMQASFHVPEPGFDHQDIMPEAPPPDGLKSEHERMDERTKHWSESMRSKVLAPRPFELRPTDPDDDPFVITPRPPKRSIWIRAAARLPDDDALHAYLLAYVSDFSFVSTALLPHGVTWMATPGMHIASLDHIMWFHRPFRVDEWLLYDIESPSARGARGLVHGRVFTQDGRLVASTAQEGLLRYRPPSPQG